MISFQVVVAHGALGPYDELIFGAVGVVFIIMMGVSWLRSRHEPEFEDELSTTHEPTSPNDSSDHIRLE